MDVVVVGGGSAGFGAAWNAARLNHSVLLVEQADRLGGTSVVGGVSNWEPDCSGTGTPRVVYQRLKAKGAAGVYWMERHCLWDSGENGIYPGSLCIIDEDAPYEVSLRRHGVGMGNEEWFKTHCRGVIFEPEVMAKTMEELLEETGHCSIMLNTAFVSAIKDAEGNVTELTLSDGTLVRPKVVIDACGAVCKAIGCQIYTSPNPNGATLMYRVAPGVEGRSEEELAATPTCWWGSMPLIFAIRYPNGEIGVNMLPTMDGAQAQRLGWQATYTECRKRVFAHWAWLKQRWPEYKNWHLKSISPVVAYRETIHVEGEYTLTGNDVKNGVRPNDEIAIADHPFDSHGASTGFSGELDQPYGVPYRCLLPKGTKNVLITGRCASFDFAAASSCRLARAMMQLGEAAGVAAVTALDKGIPLREVYPYDPNAQGGGEQVATDGTFMLSANNDGYYSNKANWLNQTSASAGGTLTLAYLNNDASSLTNAMITVDDSGIELGRIDSRAVDDAWTQVVLPMGVLTIADPVGTFSGTWSIQGNGQLRLQPPPSVPTTFMEAVGEVAEACTFHVDASCAQSLQLATEDGRQVVKRWADAEGRDNAAVASAGAQSACLLPNALNGLPVVDFGVPCADGGLEWVHTITDVVEVVMVIGSQAGGGVLLGTKQAETNYKFERGYDLQVLGGMASSGTLPDSAYVVPYRHTAGLLKERLYGKVMYGGESTQPFEVVKSYAESSGLSGGYDLIEVAASASTASAFARRAGLAAAARSGRDGAQRLAEVAIFNRELPEQVRQRLQAYLLKKWFNRDKPGFGAVRVGRVHVSPSDNYYGVDRQNHSQVVTVGGGELHIEEFKVTHQASESSPYYTVGEDEKLVLERAQIDRKLRLMGGEVELTARQTATNLPVSSPSLHLAADCGVEVNDSSSLTRWNDASGGSGYALPAGVSTQNGDLPWLVTNPDHFMGKNVVSFRQAHSGAHLQLDRQYPIAAYCMVLKVTNPKLTIMGSRLELPITPFDEWTRCNLTENLIYSSAAKPLLRQAPLWRDGLKVQDAAATHLDAAGTKAGSEFTIIAQNLVSPLMINALGCGAWQSENKRLDRTGGWELAEFIAYDRPLSEAELVDIQAYLRYKWFGETLVGYAPPGEPYRIYGVGSGSNGSTLTINGDVPVEIVSERFGAAQLVLNAPQTTIHFAEGFQPGLAAVNILQAGAVTSSGVIPNLQWANGGEITLPIVGMNAPLAVEKLQIGTNGTLKVAVTGQGLPNHLVLLQADNVDAASRTNLQGWQVQVSLNGEPVKGVFRLDWVGKKLHLGREMSNTVLTIE